MTAYDVYRLNLSATPFYNRRLFWLGLSAAFAILLVATVFLTQYYTQLLADEQRYLELQKASQSAHDLEQSRLKRVQEQSSGAGPQPTPEQARAMREALYLLERRQLSWSRLLLQMEQQLPANIRILQIAFRQDNDANPAPEGLSVVDTGTSLPVHEVPFTVTVRAPNPEAVTAFIRACDKRGIFYFDPNTQAIPSDQRRADGRQEVEFLLRGRYRPGGTILAAGKPSALEVQQ
ncbi:MAG: hypothetical protein ACUVR8_10775 [Acidobacteriota bacterium]